MTPLSKTPIPSSALLTKGLPGSTVSALFQTNQNTHAHTPTRVSYLHAGACPKEPPAHWLILLGLGCVYYWPNDSCFWKSHHSIEASWWVQVCTSTVEIIPSTHLLSFQTSFHTSETASRDNETSLSGAASGLMVDSGSCFKTSNGSNATEQALLTERSLLINLDWRRTSLTTSSLPFVFCCRYCDRFFFCRNPAHPRQTSSCQHQLASVFHFTLSTVFFILKCFFCGKRVEGEEV